MDPITGLSMGIGAVTDFIGLLQNLRAQGLSEDAAKKYLAEANGLTVPDLESLMMNAEQAAGRGDVGFSDQRAAQLDALRQMTDMANKGGMDEGSVAALQQAGARAQQQNQQARNAVQANAQRQGKWGSGQELAGQLNAIQSSANTLAMAGTQAAADARQRALQAISARGAMATNARSADEDLALQNKQAAEQRDRFNAEMRQNANQFNAGAPVKQFGMASERVGRIGDATQNYEDTLLKNKSQKDIDRLSARASAFVGGFKGE